MNIGDYFESNKTSIKKSLEKIEQLDEIIACHSHIHILYSIKWKRFKLIFNGIIF